MKPEPYQNLPGHPGVRVRIEQLDGAWTKARDAKQGEIWWDRELLMFCVAAAGPRVARIIEARDLLQKTLDVLGLTDKADPEVTMFHGVYVRASVWCAAGTFKRLGGK